MDCGTEDMWRNGGYVDCGTEDMWRNVEPDDPPFPVRRLRGTGDGGSSDAMVASREGHGCGFGDVGGRECRPTNVNGELGKAFGRVSRAGVAVGGVVFRHLHDLPMCVSVGCCRLRTCGWRVAAVLKTNSGEGKGQKRWIDVNLNANGVMGKNSV